MKFLFPFYLILLLFPFTTLFTDSWDPNNLNSILDKEWDFVNTGFDELFDPLKIDLDEIEMSLRSRDINEDEINLTMELLRGIISQEYNSLGEIIDDNIVPNYGFIETLGLIAAKETLTMEESEEILLQIKKFSDGLKILSNLSTATSFSSTTSSAHGYTDFENFTLSLGVNTSLEGSISDITSLITTPAEELTEGTEKLPLPEGVTFQGLTLNLGFPGSFLTDRLTFAVKAGSTSIIAHQQEEESVNLYKIPLYSENFTDFPMALELNTTTLGLTLSWLISEEVPLFSNSLWRGLSLHSGFIYNNFSISGEGYLKDILTSATYSPEEDIIISLHTNNHYFTVPVEITTAYRVSSFLNLSLAIGADISWGSSSYSLDISHDDLMLIYFTQSLMNNLQGVIMTSEEKNQNFFHPRISFGAGWGWKRFFLDITGHWYIEKGYALNSTIIMQF